MNWSETGLKKGDKTGESKKRWRKREKDKIVETAWIGMIGGMGVTVRQVVDKPSRT
jgi:hypothetical protein